MEAVNDLYGPWLGLMLWIGIPLLLIGTAAMFLFERGSFVRWLMSKVALWGWALVLLSIAMNIIIRILQDAFTNLPGS